MNKFGNNTINQDCVKDIFNLKQYEAEIEVTVTSNKTENKYKIRQKYNKQENRSEQEVIEPEVLQGVKIIKQNNKITLENTQLDLKKIFEEYNEIAENDMDLETFINDYNENKKSSSEENKKIILKTVSKNDNKYLKNKTLYIDKSTGKPIEMRIEDINKKTVVYIVYSNVRME